MRSATDPRSSEKWHSGMRPAERIVRLALAVGAATTLAANAARADEGGMSFWLPGTFGSFAASPSAPGWSLGALYYHASADASASKNFQIGANLVAGLHARPDLVLVAPTYTFVQPVLDGQATLSLMGGVGRMHAAVDATLSGPLGRELTRSASDSVTAGSDLYPMGTVKWKRGDSNFMAYTMIGIPVGAYDARRLANIGTNHWSVDAGGGYTYSDTRGREFSAVAGFTYNFENPDTHYRNGIDSHVDWAASQFLSAQVHAGVVGYVYRQLSGDSGSGAVLGDFKSRTNGIGPQVGYFFPFGGGKGYVNLKAYWEFDADHRAEGWNAWLTLLLPLGGAPR